MMTCLEVLRRARKLLTPQDNWTKFVAARDGTGMACSAHAPEARAFCALGALYSVTDAPTDKARDALAWEAREVLAKHLPTGYRQVRDFNDASNTRHKDVLGLFDRAIQSRR